MTKKNKEILYKHTTVGFHTFIDMVAVFEPERLSNRYKEYCEILINDYQTNKDILNIVELVRNIEVDDGDILYDSYNSISVVIYSNGNIKYVACY